MKELEQDIKIFKEVLSQSLKGPERHHFAVIVTLTKVFYDANALLSKTTNSEKKEQIFDLVKSMHPFLVAKKEELKSQLTEEEGKSPKDVELAMVSFEKETKIYSKHLKAANKDKGKKNRNKFKRRGLL